MNTTERDLRDLQAALQYREEQAAQARRQRDAGILRAVEAGMSMYRIAQVIGISQQAVAQIVKSRKL